MVPKVCDSWLWKPTGTPVAAHWARIAGLAMNCGLFAEHGSWNAGRPVAWPANSSLTEAARKPSPHEPRTSTVSVGCQRRPTFGLVVVPKDV